MRPPLTLFAGAFKALTDETTVSGRTGEGFCMKDGRAEGTGGTVQAVLPGVVGTSEDGTGDFAGDGVGDVTVSCDDWKVGQQVTQAWPEGFSFLTSERLAERDATGSLSCDGQAHGSKSIHCALSDMRAPFQ